MNNGRSPESDAVSSDPPATSLNNNDVPGKPSSSAGPSRPPRLTRQSTNTSFHAQNSLRRMATHETGHGIDESEDGHDRVGLDTHDENSEHHDDGARPVKVVDEETKIGADEISEKKKAPVLQDQTNLLPVKQVILVFVGLTCALFCSLIDQTIITTALPTLGRVFNRADISPWVGTAYLLTSTVIFFTTTGNVKADLQAMQPIYGRLSDIFGRKVVLLASLTVFWLGSLACALAQLIVFRAIQGIGGGGVLTLAMIIISDVVSLKERGKYQGITGVVVVLSNSCGPIIGGLLTERVSWRWCFYINLPMTAASIVLVFFLLPLRRVKGSVVTKIRQIDFIGSALTLAWAVLVLLALSWAGNQYAWDSAAVLAPLFIGLALLAVFIVIEIKVIPLPLIPFYILRNMTVTACMLTTFANGAAFYATLYYLPTFFQVVRGASAIRSGVLLLPLVIIQTVCAFVAGIIVSKTGDYWWNMVLGFSIWTIGLGLMSTLGPDTSEAKIAGYQVLVGIGAGQTFQTSLIAIQASVERKDMAVATGLRNFLRMLGGTIALTVCSTIINNIVSSELRSSGFSSELLRDVLNDPTMLSSTLQQSQRDAVLAAYSKGINACFYFLIPLIGISVFLTIFMVKKVPLKRSDDADKKAEAKAWVEEKKLKKAEKRHGKIHDGEGHEGREHGHDDGHDRRPSS